MSMISISQHCQTHGYKTGTQRCMKNQERQEGLTAGGGGVGFETGREVLMLSFFLMGALLAGG